MLTTSRGLRRPRPEDTRKATLVSVVAFDGLDEFTVLALAAGVAGGLDRALRAAILDRARERDIQIRAGDRLRDTTRHGVAGSAEGHAVVVGNAALFADLGLSLARFGEWPAWLRRRGEHVLFVAIDGRAAAFFGVANAPMEDTDSDGKEDSMQHSVATPSEFPTATKGLPAARATESFDLTDGQQFDLHIAPVAKRFGDRDVRMLAYNGSIPGPTLRVQQGSALVVNVTNGGDLEATVHWHGLRLENRYDGTISTQSPIPIGGTFTYSLNFPDPGVYWYHPHIREDYGQEMGLYGTIIVVPADENYWPAANRELSVTLDDLLLEGGKVAAFDTSGPTYTAMGRFGDTMLVNGEPELSLRVNRGEVVRFYLTNTANTRVFNVALSGARMKLVGGDSGHYERDTFVESVVIAPSERMVVDVLFETAGEVSLEHRTPARAYRLGTVSVGNKRAEPWLATDFVDLRTNADMVAERARLASDVTAEPDKTLALVAEMDMGEPQLSPGSRPTFICPMHPHVTSAEPGKCPQCRMKLVPAHLVKDGLHGHHDHHTPAGGDGRRECVPEDTPAVTGIEWEDDMVDVNRMTNPLNMRWKLVDRQTGAEGPSIDWRFRGGDQVKIRIVNEMDSDHPMHHPFHIHGAGRFLILSRDGVPEPNLVWKDTVLIPTGQTVDILLDVRHPGIWMAHCHIAEHHESGMFLGFRVDA